MNNLSARLKNCLEAPVLKEVRRSGGIHPSSASIELATPDITKKVVGACLRQQYYRAVNEPISNRTTADIKMSSLIGDKITDLVSELLDNFGFQAGLQRVAAEHSFYIPEIELYGRCDFIGYDHINKEYIGIEVKSVGEWKASKCVEKPAEEHVMQSLIYLNHYQTQYPELNMKRWYILYVSRTENYAIKAKKHGSPLTMVWDSHITIDPKDKAAVVHFKQYSEKWNDFTIDNIYNRYRKLKVAIDTKTMPARDYSLQYSDAEIVALRKANRLTRKLDIEKVDKWLAKGAPEGKLKVEIGDGECGFCAYRATCWPTKVASDVEIASDILDSVPNTDKPTTTDEAPWI